MTDKPRLIEFAFPLEQTSIDSVHEKNVRHGHISTLHIWPARRPLAACRAALIATLLPDPSADPKPEEMSEAEWEKEIRRRRQELCDRIGGKITEKIERKTMPNGRIVERKKRETVGGILHWIGTEPSSGGPKKIKEHREIVQNRENELEWFRQEIRRAYGGRAPRVLDPFAGGGAIPLEAMRLGCEVTAADINPVAWFILKCTLEYPQQLAGKTIPLPEFILDDEEFMNAFYKAHPHLSRCTKMTKAQKDAPGLFDGSENERAPRADLSWQVRAWGKWVLERARRQLAQYYPIYADLEPVSVKNPKPYEPQRMQLVPLSKDGDDLLKALNAEFSKEYLSDGRNPRWIAKPTIAYLWARTAICKNCRVRIPLLKTKWISNREQNRVLLTVAPNSASAALVFGIESHVPLKGGNAAQRREHDRRLGAGTMSRAGATCPCCSAIMTMEDLRVEGKAGRLGSLATAVVIDGQAGKEYRLPTPVETEAASSAANELTEVFSDIPLGTLYEPTPAGGGSGAGRAFSVQNYGLMRWSDLFTGRQLLAAGVFLKEIRHIGSLNIDPAWKGPVEAMMSMVFNRFINYLSTVCIWEPKAAEIKQTFLRFALPMTWDFAEANPLSTADRFFSGAVSSVARVLTGFDASWQSKPTARIEMRSAKTSIGPQYDVIITDPPYYDAIPYSDLMDFFYVWLKRLRSGRGNDENFSEELSPKWSNQTEDGELIDDSCRHGGSAEASKRAYEKGMATTFEACRMSLTQGGKLVIVFAHKQPDAWETLVQALIQAGFVVVGSWPIVTEMRGGIRNFGRASLASSIWLVCNTRSEAARPGWDHVVLQEMRERIDTRLRDFWDAGIRGPDFVWAATGPALESYSQHPVVKKANDPGATLSVSEFLSQVRRMVVNFVVGRVLKGESGADFSVADQLDSLTSYYLLHRNDFGMRDAPSGGCILYATACGLSDRELESTWNLAVHSGSSSVASTPIDEDDDDNQPGNFDLEAGSGSDSGSSIRLKSWKERQQKTMGYEAPGGQAVPLIDRIHRLMHLWQAGDVIKVDAYLDDNGLRRHELFKRVLQSLIELSEMEERTILEKLSNHVGAKGATLETRQHYLPIPIDETDES